MARLLRRSGVMRRPSYGAGQAAAGDAGRSVPLDPLTGYEVAARQYRTRRSDPYAAQAEAERDLGFRHPRPYQAAVVDEQVAQGLYGVREQALVAYQNLRPGDLTVTSHEAAGWRARNCGMVGALDQETLDARAWLDRRQGFAAAEYGGRSPGTSGRWDVSQHIRQLSGTLTATGVFYQQVWPDRSVLEMRALGGGAHVRVTTGLSGGGGEAARVFFLGGGFTSALELDGWENCRIAILAIDLGCVVHFAWVKKSIRAGDQTMYLPEVVTGGAVLPIPEGAYGLVIEMQDNNWQWTNTVGGPAALAVLIPAAVFAPVLGTGAVPSINNDICWFVRPI